jgi:hypothetical protein
MRLLGEGRHVTVKRLRCRLGFHRWVTAATEGERYLTCRDCGKYGGEPPTVWRYEETTRAQ